MLPYRDGEYPSCITLLIVLELSDLGPGTMLP